MKQKKFVRAVCLLMAVLMILGVMSSLLTTMASAATTKTTVKKTVHTARQPDLTFYDLKGELIGTFSNTASSNLIGFTSSRVIYTDSEGNDVETNYGRVDVTLHLCDGTGKYSTMTSTRENSYYLKYNMGSSTGEAFSNRITCSKGTNDTINLDIQLPSVVFRDSNEMKMNLLFQVPYTKTVSGKKQSYVKNQTAALSFTFSKAKLDTELSKSSSSTIDQNGNVTTDKDKDENNKLTLKRYNAEGTLLNQPAPASNDNTNNNTGDNTNNGDNTGDNSNTGNNGNTGDNSTGGNGSYGDSNTPGGGGGGTTTPPNNNGDNNNNGGDSNTPTTPDFETPYLLLQEYSTGGQDQIAAGSEFALSFTVMNTSQQVDMENIILKVAPGEGLQIVDSTNVFYLPIINKSSTYETSVNIAVLPNAEATSHPVDISFTYEYVINGARQKGEMTQQISVQTLQPDRFSADPIADLLESSVGEEIYITGKYVNKSRGDIYNLSATLVGDFNGAGKIEHIGNVAAGASGDVEFSFTPDTAGPLNGQIAYSYEDAAGNINTVNIPFSTTILEAPDDDMMAGMDMSMDMGMMDEPPVEETGLLDKLKDPTSWQMWAAIGGIVVVVLLVVRTTLKRRKAAAEFEDDDENI